MNEVIQLQYKLLIAMTVGFAWRDKGAIVEVDRSLGDKWVARGHAIRVGDHEVRAEQAGESQIVPDVPDTQPKKVTDAGFDSKDTELLIAGGLTTVAEVLAHPDLTKVDGIGKATAKRMLDHLAG